MSATLPELVADAIFMCVDLDEAPGRQDCEHAARDALQAIRAQGWRIVKTGPGTDGIGAHLPTVEIAEEWTG